MGGYVCSKCGKWFDNYYAAGGHYGQCKGIQFNYRNIVQMADDLVYRKGDGEWLKGLVIMGLMVLAGFVLFSESKEKGKRKGGGKR